MLLQLLAAVLTRPPAAGLARADIQLLHALSLAKLPPADIQAVAQYDIASGPCGMRRERKKELRPWA